MMGLVLEEERHGLDPRRIGTRSRESGARSPKIRERIGRGEDRKRLELGMEAERSCEECPGVEQVRCDVVGPAADVRRVSRVIRSSMPSRVLENEAEFTANDHWSGDGGPDLAPSGCRSTI